MNQKRMIKEIIAVLFLILNYFIFWKNGTSFSTLILGIEINVSYLMMMILPVYLFFYKLDNAFSIFTFIGIILFSFLNIPEIVIPLLFINDIAIQKRYSMQKSIFMQNILNTLLFILFANFFIHKNQGLEITSLNYFLMIIIVSAKQVIQFFYRKTKDLDERSLFNFIVLLLFYNSEVVQYSEFLLPTFASFMLFLAVLFFTKHVNQKRFILKESSFFLSLSLMVMGDIKLATLYFLTFIIYTNNISFFSEVIVTLSKRVQYQYELKVVLISLTFSILSPVGIIFYYIFHYSLISPLLFLVALLTYLQLIARYFIDDIFFERKRKELSKIDIGVKSILSLITLYLYVGPWKLEGVIYTDNYSVLWVFILTLVLIPLTPLLIKKLNKDETVRELIKSWKTKFPRPSVQDELTSSSNFIIKKNRASEMSYEKAISLNEGTLASVGLLIIITLVLLFLKKVS